MFYIYTFKKGATKKDNKIDTRELESCAYFLFFPAKKATKRSLLRLLRCCLVYISRRKNLQEGTTFAAIYTPRYLYTITPGRDSIAHRSPVNFLFYQLLLVTV